MVAGTTAGVNLDSEWLEDRRIDRQGKERKNERNEKEMLEERDTEEGPAWIVIGLRRETKDRNNEMREKQNKKRRHGRQREREIKKQV